MKYFTIAELERSETAVRYKINNRMPPEVVENYTAFVDDVLNKVREQYGKPITITSGYRCIKLNEKVRGSKNSAHIGNGYAAAVDIQLRKNGKVDKEANKKVFELIKKMKLDGIITFDQLINEQMDYSWIHIGYNRKGINREQILVVK